MKNPLYLSLVSGAVGIMIGAGSVYVGQAGIIKIHGAAFDRPTPLEIQDQGIKNQRSDTHTRVGVPTVKPVK